VQQKLAALEGLFPGPKGNVVCYRPQPGQPGRIVDRPPQADSLIAELRHRVEQLTRQIRELRVELDKKR
jgi:hypothetical protein